MSLVPPKRGQKNKSKVLNHFNNAELFQLVEINGDNETCEYAVLDSEKSKKGVYFVWKGHDLISKQIDYDKLRAVNIPMPAKHAYEEITATIGGIGKHTRWKVVISKKKITGKCTLLVTQIKNKDKFEEFVTKNIRPFGFCDFEYEIVNDVVTTIVQIPDHKDLTYVAAAFHCANYAAIPLDDDMASSGSLGIERYDRSEHTWWNQNQQEAGPLRDTHKWKYSFIPSHWKKLPFTWLSLAENIDVDVKDIHEIPYPLRNYVCNEKLKNTDDSVDIDILTRNKTEFRCVTSRLTYDQNIQLLQCTYWTFVAPFDKKIVELSGLLLFRYMLHGYIGRENGGYKQNALYIGHGAYVRQFNNKPQYKYENLQNKVRNKLECTDGVIKGNGFKGTRGKYGHESFPIYKPIKKMKRSLESELFIREVPSNKFEEYKDCKL